MKNKILIAIIVIIVFVGGLFVGAKFKSKENTDIPKVDNEIKYSLDGVYVTGESKSGSVEDSKGNKTETNSIQVLTFYSNNSVSSYTVSINDIKGIGKSISKGEITTGTYTLSNESKTILMNLNMNGSVRNRTFTFENGYKTIRENGTEYNLIDTTLDEYLPKETINDPRNTGFSGLYEYKTETNGGGSLYKGKRLLKTIHKYSLEFLTDGTVIEKNGGRTIVYSDGTKEEGHKPIENKYKYTYNKDNNTIFIYSGTYIMGIDNGTYTITKDLKTIKNNDNGMKYKLVEN